MTHLKLQKLQKGDRGLLLNSTLTLRRCASG